MSVDPHVSSFFESGEPVVSLEFFPPKNEEGGAQMLKTAERVREQVSPDFVSITYGAGGSTRERTLRYARMLRNDFGFAVMPHLTCVGSSYDEMDEIVSQYHEDGFRNIMTLRGDPPKGETEFRPHPNGPHYASDLVTHLRAKHPDFCLGVAGYPEKHPEAESLGIDLKNLKRKVDNGASFVTTQLFFDNEHYFDFVSKCHEAGIEQPIFPGLLPVVSLKQIVRFCDMCGASLPEKLIKRLEEADGDPAAVEDVGVTWAVQQLRELFERGAPGVHLYILNRSKSAVHLMQALREEGLIKKA